MLEVVSDEAQRCWLSIYMGLGSFQNFHPGNFFDEKLFFLKFHVFLDLFSKNEISLSEIKQVKLSFQVPVCTSVVLDAIYQLWGIFFLKVLFW